MVIRDYSDTFSRLGRRLRPSDGVPEDEIAAAEDRLGCRAPEALRSFYRLAGQAMDFTEHYDQFLHPSDWSVEGGKLVFLVENQGVVLYAVDADSTSRDPPVVMASNQETLDWYEVCGQCSEFLDVMLHWEGAFGHAMNSGGFAIVDEAFRELLERDFRTVGEVNGMWAYSKPGVAACFVQWDGDWRVFVGAANDALLAQAEHDFGIQLETAGRS